MLTESEVRAICDNVLAVSSAPATEARVLVEQSALTRLANNEVSQSVSKDRTDVNVRVLLGPADAPTQVGVATTNRLDDAGLKQAVERAIQSAQAQHDNPTLLPPVGPQAYQAANAFDPHTADCPPDARVEPLREVLARCRRENRECAGAFATAGRARAIATSAGLFAFDRKTHANLSLTVARDGVSGWAEQITDRVADIDVDQLAGRAFDIAGQSASPRPIEPGRYAVVLPAEAVADMLRFLVASLCAKAIIEGRSFFAGKLGQRVFGPNVDVIDDAYHPLTSGLPFDGEGLPRQRVPIIESGVFARMVHGRETARLANAQPTGHGMPAPTPEGAAPLNLVIPPGAASIEEMIASVDRGLLVTHFHYVNMLRPVDLTITGMTRDGLFLIENGKVGPAVNNMRFTQSLVGAFNSVRTIGREMKPLPGMSAGNFAAPPLIIDGFNFSSATEF